MPIQSLSPAQPAFIARLFPVFKKIFIGLVLIVAVLAVVIALQPAEFRITRSITIAAPPATVFSLINDFHQWNQWSPWEKMDPEMKKTYEGTAAGAGAIYTWSGNDKVGKGNMTLTESKPNDLILIRLEFIEPMEAVSGTEFTLKPEGDGTHVNWTMTGQNNFIGKAFHLFMDVDKMVGSDFEKGLADLKKSAEATAK